MFPADSNGVRRKAGPICRVVFDAGGLTADPGVHVLDCGTRPLHAAGRVHRLQDIGVTPVGQVHDDAAADRSEQVRRALEALNIEHRFTEIHFPSLGGLGFRTIQARNAGLAFIDATLVVHFDSTSRQERERRQVWPAGPDDLTLDYMEQYCLDHANRKVAVGDSKPLVTIGIAHYNLGRYLPEALESLSRQTYKHLEVIVVDDGSTTAESINAVSRLERDYPNIRFLRQANAGIGATRNRLLAEARGEFFIPMDADNIARPEMVESFVRAMNRNPHCSAMTCYFEAFTDEEPDTCIYACRPAGGPHVLSCIRNIYGDANGIFRTADFRASGGYETDRGTSCEDWEAYVKLIHAGKQIDVAPEYLFRYRHRETGFSRATNWYANHQRVLRQFTPQNELWIALLGFQQQIELMKEQRRRPHYRVADAIHNGIAKPYHWMKRQLTRHS